MTVGELVAHLLVAAEVIHAPGEAFGRIWNGSATPWPSCLPGEVIGKSPGLYAAIYGKAPLPMIRRFSKRLTHRS